jgi:seryl-tRNA synthetase
VRLNHALINYGLSVLSAKEYTPLQTPYFMNQDVMGGVAQLSEFDEALYAVHSGEDKKYLIATSEQPICAYHKDEWLTEKELPIRCVGPQARARAPPRPPSLSCYPLAA